jgi:L-threonylcarbamoyladenylate synthase
MDYREDLREALKVLREGGVILYPTDTVWGLGCDATNKEAVEKIFEIKKRKEGQSLIILVNGVTMLERYVREVPKTASMITEFSDGPVTIIYPRGRNLAPGVCAEDGSVGIRITGDDFCNQLITLFRKPIVSTSANISNEPAPSDFSEIKETIINSVSYVVKHRRADRKRSSPSPIIKTENDGSFKIIRQ